MKRYSFLIFLFVYGCSFLSGNSHEKMNARRILAQYRKFEPLYKKYFIDSVFRPGMINTCNHKELGFDAKQALADLDSGKFRFVIIAFCKLNENIKNYTHDSDITDYLEFDSTNFVSEVIALRGNEPFSYCQNVKCGSIWKFDWEFLDDSTLNDVTTREYNKKNLKDAANLSDEMIFQTKISDISYCYIENDKIMIRPLPYYKYKSNIHLNEFVRDICSESHIRELYR